MATTTVRLDTEDERLLDDLAESFGGRSNAIRQAIRALSAGVERRRALETFVESWDADAGAIPAEAVDEIADAYDL